MLMVNNQSLLLYVREPSQDGRLRDARSSAAHIKGETKE